MKCIELNKGHVAIVDDEDFERLAQWRWYLHKSSGYVYRKLKREGRWQTTALHHEILTAPPGKFVDHRNLNKLDNRRQNLRIATRSQNGMNRGVLSNNELGLKGVSRDKSKTSKTPLFVARITVDGKTRGLGYFKTPEEASAAYAAAARELHGDFHRLN